ncbi:hypothetical protein [Prescottella subtropica]|uniref:hypothetical protein n=1 Tax=Prescottella subtropica TaxID=2545757 RepID=UPI0010F5B7EA|nr:hypothetical protein [Prescottella subtropica]
MEISVLRQVVAGLGPRQPLTDAFECYPDTSAQRFSSQKEHLLGWLAGYDGPGSYNRKNPGKDARFFYTHFRCAPGLLWLAEALGEDPATLTEAIGQVKAARANPSSQCAAFRRVVPWERIVELVEQNKTRTASTGGPVERIARWVSRLRS